MSHAYKEFLPLNIAVLTLSDTRTLGNDSSGDLLIESLQEDGHRLAARQLIKDDVYQLRALVCAWIANPEIQAVVITGGTGFTRRDTTPEALLPIFDKEIEGFGELFRYLSYQEIGTSTIQSRAVAGLSNNTVIFCLPGSTGACRTAWNGIIRDQLNSTYKPCNFIPHLVVNTPACETRP